MIKPDQIPDEVVEAYNNAWASPAELIAAALNAWPGVKVEPTHEGYPAWPHIILPLPQKGGDA